MLKTRLDKAKEFITCLRPSCVFVAIPWGMGKMAKEWIQGFRGDYNLVPLDLIDSSANMEVDRLMENGSVMVYGTPPDDFIELDDIFDVEYALVWLYPNKQTDYFEYIRRMPLGCDRRFVPIGSEKIWSHITKCDDRNAEMKHKLNTSMTRVCYCYQKKLMRNYLKSENRDGRILLIVC